MAKKKTRRAAPRRRRYEDNGYGGERMMNTLIGGAVAIGTLGLVGGMLGAMRPAA